MNPSSGSCPFCDRIAAGEALIHNDHAAGFPDGYPLSPGHMLVVPLRHKADYFLLTHEERLAIHEITNELHKRLVGDFHPTGFNIGVNVGEDAGKTVGHAHLQLIPRYEGDVEDPRGGVRWTIPIKAVYWNTPRA